MKIALALLLPALALTTSGCKRPLKVHVSFDDAEGLAAGAPVLHRGVRIGTVEGTKVEGGKAVVTVVIEKEHRESIRGGAEFLIRTPGIMDSGVTALVVEEAGSGEPLESGAHLEGLTRLQRFARRASAAATSLKKDAGAWLKQLRQLAGSPEARAWLLKAKAEAEKARAGGEEAFKKFRKETLPELKKELDELERRFDASGKGEQIRKIRDEFLKLFE
jgi:hypothetical protein